MQMQTQTQTHTNRLIIYINIYKVPACIVCADASQRGYLQAEPPDSLASVLLPLQTAALLELSNKASLFLKVITDLT